MIETSLITNYFDWQIAMGHMGVIWFGASIPICGVIIKYTLEYKLKEKDRPCEIVLAGLIGFFFIALIAYGLLSAYYVRQISQGVLGLLPLKTIVKGNATIILECVTYFYLFPTFAFASVFVAWLWLIKNKRDK